MVRISQAHFCLGSHRSCQPRASRSIWHAVKGGTVFSWPSMGCARSAWTFHLTRFGRHKPRRQPQACQKLTGCVPISNASRYRITRSMWLPVSTIGIRVSTLPSGLRFVQAACSFTRHSRGTSFSLRRAREILLTCWNLVNCWAPSVIGTWSCMRKGQRSGPSLHWWRASRRVQTAIET